MRIKASVRWGLVVVVLYAAWLTGWSMYFEIDYRTIAAPENILLALVLPLAIATVALAAFAWWSGWARTAFSDPHPARHPGLLATLLLLMAGCIGLNFSSVTPGALDVRYLLVLGAAMLMVGFCEELLTRGLLLVGLRQACKSEVAVWFWSSLVFGSLHALNGLMGLGYMAFVQVVFAFCAGTLLYLLRRMTGSLLVPIFVHALWDFSTFIPAAGNVETPPSDTVLLMLTHLVSMIVVVMFFRHQRNRSVTLAH